MTTTHQRPAIVTLRVLLMAGVVTAASITGITSVHRSQRGKAAPASAQAIRKVDFMNFTYHPGLCNEAFHIGTSVEVKRGDFGDNATGPALFSVFKPVYGDLTGDDQEEAVVSSVCEPAASNDPYVRVSEIFVFTLNNAMEPTLLGEINDASVSHDYQRAFPNSSYCGVVVGPTVRIQNGKLLLGVAGDGPVCCPKTIAHFQYVWNGSKFVVVGKPWKSPAKDH